MFHSLRIVRSWDNAAIVDERFRRAASHFLTCVCEPAPFIGSRDSAGEVGLGTAVAPAVPTHHFMKCLSFSRHGRLAALYCAHRFGHAELAAFSRLAIVRREMDGMLRWIK